MHRLKAEHSFATDPFVKKCFFYVVCIIKKPAGKPQLHLQV